MNGHRDRAALSPKRRRSLARVREALWARLDSETQPNRRVSIAAAHLQYALKRVDAGPAREVAEAAVSYLVDAAEGLLTGQEKGANA
ncbi:MAG: hypothetical protein ACRDRL_03465 [Sciscionella sp.]